MTNNDNQLFEACDHCGTPFKRDTRYPAVLDSDENGKVNIYSFCDEECQSAWADD